MHFVVLAEFIPRPTIGKLGVVQILSDQSKISREFQLPVCRSLLIPANLHHLLTVVSNESCKLVTL
jgi:hypothetical protein